jgi:hypothetical protein
MENDIQKDYPWLHRQQQQGDGFKVPEDYFDTFEDRLMGRIEADGITPNRPVHSSPRLAIRAYMPRLAMAAAAACALLLAAVWFFRPTPEEVLQQVASVELSEEEIETYVLDHVHDFETEQLAMLPEEEMEAEPAVTPEKAGAKNRDLLDEIAPEDVEQILYDMTEEELEDIL